MRRKVFRLMLLSLNRMKEDMNLHKILLNIRRRFLKFLVEKKRSSAKKEVPEEHETALAML